MIDFNQTPRGSLRSGLQGESCFLGDPPPDPRFLASLGALSVVGLDHCTVLEILASWTGPNEVRSFADKSLDLPPGGRGSGGLAPREKEDLVSSPKAPTLSKQTPLLVRSLPVLLFAIRATFSTPHIVDLPRCILLTPVDR